MAGKLALAVYKEFRAFRALPAIGDCCDLRQFPIVWKPRGGEGDLLAMRQGENWWHELALGVGPMCEAMLLDLAPDARDVEQRNVLLAEAAPGLLLKIDDSLLLRMCQ